MSQWPLLPSVWLLVAGRSSLVAGCALPATSNPRPNSGAQHLPRELLHRRDDRLGERKPAGLGFLDQTDEGPEGHRDQHRRIAVAQRTGGLAVADEVADRDEH